VLSRKVRVSLCMIVRDEERNLEACLAPIAELFDEIVIVDTGSLDRTKEIARQFNARVFDFEWSDDFSAARNESMRHATGEWIFWLDADDRVRPEHVAKLRELFQQLDDRPRVYMLETMLPPHDQVGDLEFVTHARLFRRHSELQWRGRVHEQLHPEFPVLGYEQVFTDIQIDHLGYTDRTIAERKARRKMRLLRMDYAVDPNDVSTLFHLGMALRHSPYTAEAKSHLLRLIKLPIVPRVCMRFAYDALAHLALKAGNPHEALMFVAHGLALFPDDEQLLLSRATAQYNLEDYEAAGRTLEQLISAPPVQHMHFTSLAHLRAKIAPVMLGTVRRLQGRYADSEAIFHAVLRSFPDDNTCWFNLGLLYLDQRHKTATQSVIDRLQGLPGGDASAGLLASLWHLRHGDPALAGPIIDRLIANEPRAPRPRMLRAEFLSRTKATFDAQIRALRDVLRIEPGDLETQRWLELITQAQEAAQQPASAGSFAASPQIAAASV